MLSIKTNLTGLLAQSALKTCTNKLNQAVERLSSGYKINHSSDNAANYYISTDMTTKIGAYQVAEENVSMGLDMLATVSDTLSMMQDNAARLNALALQARNGTYDTQSLSSLNTEANAIVAEILRAYNNTEYNGIALLNKSVRVSDTNSKTSTNEFIDNSVVSEAYKSGTGKFIADIVQDTPDITVTDPSKLADAISANKKIGIGNAETLEKLAEIVNSGTNCSGKTIILTEDISLSGYDNWTPIGSSGRFKGDFNGNGHTISDITISRSEPYQALFGKVEDSLIQNIGIESVSISGFYDVAGLAAYANNVSINNCYVADGNIEADNTVGGLVAEAGSISVFNCYSNINVKATSVTNNSGCAGGLIGNSLLGSIANSYSSGSVTGVSSYTGGLVGAFLVGTISNCYAENNVSGNTEVGGLIGGGTIFTITDSYATGKIVGNKYVGSLIGCTLTDYSENTTVNNCYATGKAGGSEGVGSLIGAVVITQDGTKLGKFDIINCAAMGADKGIGGVYQGNSSPYTPYSYDTTEWLKSISELAQESGDSNESITLQIGIHNGVSSEIQVNINFQFDFESLNGGIESLSTFNAIQSFELLLNEKQTEIGSAQNRLESALDEISIQYDNLLSSRSTLMDVDMADMSAEYIQQQILQQASATLMATANQTPAIALRLI